ncbi:Olfactory receptor 9 [Sciurus carolinensis]|uniref:Olfactory receptor 9 n=1 Tax=Sciurus carolinensis TaxID=30640 RepID=A0AA41TCL6_SCICA|nr:Olfactory receptor 9 [Sciurus carolinensis]
MDFPTSSLLQPLSFPSYLLLLREPDFVYFFQSGFGDMEGGNGTAVTEFVLMGFSGFGSFWCPLFWGLLCIYLITLLGNSPIVVLTLADSALHSPLYFFLRHFSLVEILYTTTIVPRMLADLLSSRPTIPRASCFTQLYFFALFGVTECCLLTVMAYDPYAAICRPLRHPTLMKWVACVGMVWASYLMGVITGTTHSIFIFALPFHGASTVHHFLCDILPVLRLASGSTF